MKKITPFLWFNNNAEEAIEFYTSIFKNSKKISEKRFELEGQEFLAFDGGPMFRFNAAVSLFVDCKTQEEVDTLWQKLSEGGEIKQCGWIKDKFGLFWQIIPTILGDMLSDDNEEKAERVQQAMLNMTKIDIETLKKAYDG